MSKLQKWLCGDCHRKHLSQGTPIKQIGWNRIQEKSQVHQMIQNDLEQYKVKVILYMFR